MKAYPDGLLYCQKHSNNYATVVSCAKICRNVGILSSLDVRHEYGRKFIYENIDSNILENTVVSDDEQVKSSFLFCFR